ncbi:unnamed protein product [Calypogeia fissa]
MAKTCDEMNSNNFIRFEVREKMMEKSKIGTTRGLEVTSRRALNWTFLELHRKLRQRIICATFRDTRQSEDFQDLQWKSQQNSNWESSRDMWLTFKCGPALKNV